MALRHRILPVAAAVGVVVLALMPAAPSAADPIDHQWTLDSLTNPPGGANGDLPGVAWPQRTRFHDRAGVLHRRRRLL